MPLSFAKHSACPKPLRGRSATDNCQPLQVEPHREPHRGLHCGLHCGKSAELRAASEANAAFRAHMEDSSVVIDPLLAEPDGELWGYFAVYDGHGGRQAVDFCEAKLHGLVLDELLNVTRLAGEPVADDTVADVLFRAFRRVDEQLKLLGTWRCGCTATVVLAHRTPAGQMRLHAWTNRYPHSEVDEELTAEASAGSLGTTGRPILLKSSGWKLKAGTCWSIGFRVSSFCFEFVRSHVYVVA
ncbi:PTC1 [Symbiodinium natans]|uniref:PTC1 protein n=1 Tax=Symbiodinium natans TaxID=878477 RepID=A0A812TEI5_9DINO|nr:PTC1 [Symbiodinium natans]